MGASLMSSMKRVAVERPSAWNWAVSAASSAEALAKSPLARPRPSRPSMAEETAAASATKISTVTRTEADTMVKRTEPASTPAAVATILLIDALSASP